MGALLSSNNELEDFSIIDVTGNKISKSGKILRVQFFPGKDVEIEVDDDEVIFIDHCGINPLSVDSLFERDKGRKEVDKFDKEDEDFKKLCQYMNDLENLCFKTKSKFSRTPGSEELLSLCDKNIEWLDDNEGITIEIVQTELEVLSKCIADVESLSIKSVEKSVNQPEGKKRHQPEGQVIENSESASTNEVDKNKNALVSGNLTPSDKVSKECNMNSNLVKESKNIPFCKEGKSLSDKKEEACKVTVNKNEEVTQMKKTEKENSPLHESENDLDEENNFIQRQSVEEYEEKKKESLEIGSVTSDHHESQSVTGDDEVIFIDHCGINPLSVDEDFKKLCQYMNDLENLCFKTKSKFSRTPGSEELLSLCDKNFEWLDDNEGITIEIVQTKLEVLSKCIAEIESWSSKSVEKSVNQPENSKGVVVVFNYIFRGNKNYREGAEMDSLNIKQVFSALGYKVLVHEDLTKEATFEKMWNIFTLDCDAPEAVLLFFLSHGDGQNDFLAADHSTISIQDIKHRLTNSKCPAMQGKPKIAFFNFCRGENKEKVTNLLEYDCRFEEPQNFAIVQASQPGIKAARSRADGSVFVSCLCEVLLENASTKSLQEIVNLTAALMKRKEGTTASLKLYLPFPTFFFRPQS